MPAPKSNLTCISPLTGDSNKATFWVSEPELIDDGHGDWGFALYADEDVFIAMFVYPPQDAAARAIEALVPVVTEATFIATAES